MSFYAGVCQHQGLEGWDSECRTRERIVGRVGSVKTQGKSAMPDSAAISGLQGFRSRRIKVMDISAWKGRISSICGYYNMHQESCSPCSIPNVALTFLKLNSAGMRGGVLLFML